MFTWSWETHYGKDQINFSWLYFAAAFSSLSGRLMFKINTGLGRGQLSLLCSFSPHLVLRECFIVSHLRCHLRIQSGRNAVMSLGGRLGARYSYIAIWFSSSPANWVAPDDTSHHFGPQSLTSVTSWSHSPILAVSHTWHSLPNNYRHEACGAK